MQLSYFCRHCGNHLRKGDHSACRKAERAERKSTTEAARLSAGERNRQRYANGTLGEVLAKTEKPE